MTPEAFNHHQAADFIKLELGQMEGVKNQLYARLKAYKNKPGASTEYVARAEEEIEILHNAIATIRQDLDALTLNFSQAISAAYARGMEAQQRRDQRQKRYNGIDPLNPMPHQREALREYNIAHQRFIDNI